jgi:hypothetical protein
MTNLNVFPISPLFTQEADSNRGDFLKPILAIKDINMFMVMLTSLSTLVTIFFLHVLYIDRFIFMFHEHKRKHYMYSTVHGLDMDMDMAWKLTWTWTWTQTWTWTWARASAH